MADCCENGLKVEELQGAHRRVLVVVMLINIVTFGGMVVASWMSHSSALLSGTLDNLGDALTYAASLAVIGASNQAKGRVALFKGVLISLAALAVAFQVGWRLTHMEVPIVTTMGIAALLNLAANTICLLMLTPYRHDDVNMSSVWECSRNDVTEGIALIVTTGLVFATGSAWPDLLVATILLVMFSRSAYRVLQSGWVEVQGVRTA